jgi:hypothetical protein
MRNSNNQRRWFSFGWRVFATVLLLWGGGGAWAAAQEGLPPAVRIEEDWELVVNQPDIGDNGPQVTCAISPSSMDAVYAAFDVNYCTQPAYSPGGLQLHTWDPFDPIVTQDFPATTMLATPDETITWTMRMRVSEGWLKFKIVNGQSETWGAFASPRSIAIPTQLTSLDSYSPGVSVAASGVSFASNLVVSLKLKAVRWYDASGNLIQQVTDPQVVHPKP